MGGSARSRLQRTCGASRGISAGGELRLGTTLFLFSTYASIEQRSSREVLTWVLRSQEGG